MEQLGRKTKLRMSVRECTENQGSELTQWNSLSSDLDKTSFTGVKEMKI